MNAWLKAVQKQNADIHAMLWSTFSIKNDIIMVLLEIVTIIVYL